MELKTITVGYDKEATLAPFRAHGILVPRGFVFDGASAPRMFWIVIPPFKRTKKAAVIHDWLCSNAKDKEDRLLADKLFFKMLGEAGLSKVRCKMGYYGVRVGAMIGIGVHYKHWTDRWKR